MENKFDLHPISAVETRALRHRVLRPMQRPDELVYRGDDAPDALHAGAFCNGELIGIASVSRESPLDETNPRAWRLRGMATLPQFQRQGVGRALIDLCLAHILAHNGNLIWCHGRTSARAFYESLGFYATGDEFMAPLSGPHFVFRRTLP